VEEIPEPAMVVVVEAVEEETERGDFWLEGALCTSSLIPAPPPLGESCKRGVCVPFFGVEVGRAAANADEAEALEEIPAP